MKIAGTIDEQGWRSRFTAEPTAIADVGARAALVEAALGAIELLSVPLAIELERGVISSESGKFIEMLPPVIFVEPKIPAGIVVSATIDAAPVQHQRALDAKSVRRALDEVRHPGAKIVDWRRVQVIASAARAAEGSESLSLEQFPGRTLAPMIRGADRFFAGPIDAAGWRSFPPVSVRLFHDRGVVSVELGVYWSPWADVATPEYVFYRRAQRALEAIGFTPEET